MTRRPLLLHVGSSKTGTSALQLALWNSTDALAASGLGIPLVGRGATVQRLLRPLGWVAASGFVEDIDAGGLDRLVTQLRDTPGDRLMISNEDLVEAPTEHISALMQVAEAADLDVRLIVTARDWARQLPSEWQQLLKDRVTLDYESFIAQVRDHDGVHGEIFWRRQDFVGVCDRWGAGLDPARVHLVPVPAKSVDRDAVFRVFSELAGFDPSTLTIDSRNINQSFGYTEAEMLRRLNLALGDRLPDFEKEYMPAFRRVLVQHVIPRGRAPRITLPPAHEPWVRQVTQGLVSTALARGYTVHGDLRLLEPDPSAVGPLPSIDESDMAAATLRTLADFAVAVFEEKQRAKAKRRARAAGTTRSEGEQVARTTRERARQLIRRLRS